MTRHQPDLGLGSAPDLLNNNSLNIAHLNIKMIKIKFSTRYNQSEALPRSQVTPVWKVILSFLMNVNIAFHNVWHSYGQ